MNKKILITGGSGFIGREACAFFIKNKFKVIAILRNDDKFLRDIGVNIIIGSMFNEKLAKKSLTEIDIVVHLAANATFGNGKNYYEENFLLTKKLVDLLKKKQTKLIFISTIGAVDRHKKDFGRKELTELDKEFPSSDYGKSKLECEKYIRENLENYSILRPSLVIGENMRLNSHFAKFAQMVFNDNLISRIKWTGTFSLITVNDLISAIYFCCKNKKTNKETFFCSGEKIRLYKFFNLCDPKKIRIPINFFEKYFYFLTFFFPFKLKALILPMLTASSAKLRRLGWKPKNNIYFTLQQIINREKSRKNPFNIPLNGLSIVTGASSGLGFNIAKSLIKIRKKLILIDNDINGLKKKFKKEKNCFLVKIDLSNEKEVDNFLNSKLVRKNKIIEYFGCAGIGFKQKFANSNLNKQIQTYKVNLISNIQMSYSFIQKMKIYNFGRIVLISSSSAFQPLPYMATYASSKSALLFFGEAIQSELNENGINVLNILPGGIKTNFQKKAGVKINNNERLLDPEILSKIIISNLSKKNSFVISLNANLMLFISKIMPKILLVPLYKKLMREIR